MPLSPTKQLDDLNTAEQDLILDNIQTGFEAPPESVSMQADDLGLIELTFLPESGLEEAMYSALAIKLLQQGCSPEQIQWIEQREEMLLNIIQDHARDFISLDLNPERLIRILSGETSNISLPLYIQYYPHLKAILSPNEMLPLVCHSRAESILPAFSRLAPRLIDRFTISLLLKVVYGGEAAALEALEHYYSDLEITGFNEDQMARAASSLRGPENLKILATNYYVLSDLGFNHELQIQLTEKQGNSDSFEALAIHYETLNNWGFAKEQMIAVTANQKGSRAFEDLMLYPLLSNNFNHQQIVLVAAMPDCSIRFKALQENFDALKLIGIRPDQMIQIITSLDGPVKLQTLPSYYRERMVSSTPPENFITDTGPIFFSLNELVQYFLLIDSSELILNEENSEGEDSFLGTEIESETTESVQKRRRRSNSERPNKRRRDRELSRDVSESDAFSQLTLKLKEQGFHGDYIQRIGRSDKHLLKTIYDHVDEFVELDLNPARVLRLVKSRVGKNPLELYLQHFPSLKNILLADQMITMICHSDGESIVPIFSKIALHLNHVFMTSWLLKVIYDGRALAFQALAQYYLGLGAKGFSYQQIIRAAANQNGAKNLKDLNEYYPTLSTLGFDHELLLQFILGQTDDSRVYVTLMQYHRALQSIGFNQKQMVLAAIAKNANEKLRALAEYSQGLLNLGFTLDQLIEIVINQNDAEHLNVLEQYAPALLNNGFNHNQLVEIAVNPKAAERFKFLEEYSQTLLNQGFDFYQLIEIAVSSEFAKTFRALAEYSQPLFNKGFGSNQLIEIAVSQNGDERLKVLDEHCQALFDQGFDIEQLIEVVGSENREGLKVLKEYSQTLFDKGFDYEQLIEIVISLEGAASLKALAEYGQTLLDKGFNSDQLLQVATSPNGGERLEALQNHSQTLLNKGYQLKQLVQVVISPNGAESLKVLKNQSQPLFNKGYSREQLVQVVVCPKGAGLLRALKNQSQSLFNKGYNCKQLVQVIISQTGINGLRALDKYHQPLLENGLTHQQLLILIVLPLGNYRLETLNQYYQFLHGKGFEKTEMFWLLSRNSTTFKRKFKALAQYIETLFSKGFVKDQILRIFMMGNGAEVPYALVKYYPVLHGYGFSNEQLVKWTQIVGGADIIEAMSLYYLPLCDLGFDHQELINFAKTGRKSAFKIVKIKSLILHFPYLKDIFSKKQLFEVLGRPNGAENLAALAYYYQSLYNQGFNIDLLLRLTVAKYPVSNNLHTLELNGARLRAMGFNNSQLTGITASVHGAKNLEALIEHYLELDLAGFTCELIFQLVIAVDNNISNHLVALKQNSLPLLEKGFSAAQLIELLAKTRINATKKMKALYQYTEQLLNKKFSHAQLIQVASSPEGEKCLDALNQYFDKLHAKGFDHAQLIQAVSHSGGGDNLHALNQYFAKLHAKGFEHAQLIQAVSYSGGNKNLYALNQYFDDLSAKGFDRAQMIEAVSNSEGKKNLRALNQYFDELSAKGFNHAQLIKIVSIKNKFDKLENLNQHFDGLKEKGFNVEEICQLFNDEGDINIKLMLLNQHYQDFLSLQFENADIVRLFSHGKMSSLILLFILKNKEAILQSNINPQTLIKYLLMGRKTYIKLRAYLNSISDAFRIPDWFVNTFTQNFGINETELMDYDWVSMIENLGENSLDRPQPNAREQDLLSGESRDPQEQTNIPFYDEFDELIEAPLPENFQLGELQEIANEILQRPAADTVMIDTYNQPQEANNPRNNLGDASVEQVSAPISFNEREGGNDNNASQKTNTDRTKSNKKQKSKQTKKTSEENDEQLEETTTNFQKNKKDENAASPKEKKEAAKFLSEIKKNKNPTAQETRQICDAMSKLLPLSNYDETKNHRYKTIFKDWTIAEKPIFEWYVYNTRLLFNESSDVEDIEKELRLRTIKILKSKKLTNDEKKAVLNLAIATPQVGTPLLEKLKKLGSACERGELPCEGINLDQRDAVLLIKWLKESVRPADTYETSLRKPVLTASDVVKLQQESSQLLLIDFVAKLDQAYKENTEKTCETLINFWEKNADIFLKFWTLNDEQLEGTAFIPVRRIQFLEILFKKKQTSILEKIFWPHLFFPDSSSSGLLVERVEFFLLRHVHNAVVNHRLELYEINGHNVFYWYMHYSKNTFNAIETILQNQNHVAGSILKSDKMDDKNPIVFYLTEKKVPQIDKNDFQERLKRTITAAGFISQGFLFDSIKAAFVIYIQRKFFTANEILGMVKAISPSTKTKNFYSKLMLLEKFLYYEILAPDQAEMSPATTPATNRSPRYSFFEFNEIQEKGNIFDPKVDKFDSNIYLNPELNNGDVILKNIETGIIKCDEIVTFELVRYKIGEHNPIEYFILKNKDKSTRFIRHMITHAKAHIIETLVNSKVDGVSALNWYLGAHDIYNSPAEAVKERLCHFLASKVPILIPSDKLREVLRYMSSLSNVPFSAEFFDELKNIIKDNNLLIYRNAAATLLEEIDEIISLRSEKNPIHQVTF